MRLSCRFFYWPAGKTGPDILKRFFHTRLFWCFIFLLSSCGVESEFHIKDLAKTDIDAVAEIHLNEATLLLKELTLKLYKRNPSELAKSGGHTIETRIKQIFVCPAPARYEELGDATGTDAILLAFEPDFTGDRVFAMMTGLYTMLLKSYNDRCELFMFDILDEQNLYNSARNIEILVWRLKTRLDKHGRPILMTNSMNGEPRNLSYERLFGKLIGLQDTMAKIVSKRTGRIIKEVVSIAGMAFLPIGI